MERYDKAHSFLPPKAQDWLGVDDQDPLLGEDTMARWNDNQSATFPTIALLIEKHWLKEGPTTPVEAPGTPAPLSPPSQGEIGATAAQLEAGNDTTTTKG